MSYKSLVREPATPPIIPLPQSRPFPREILFRHPGYNNSNNIILKLFAPDEEKKEDGVIIYGLYAQFALDACGVIVGNRWDGWLSRSKEPNATKETPTSLLQEASYYFHLPDSSSDVPYPVVPNFTEWRFPHNDGSQLPATWQQLNLGRNPVQHSARSDFSAALRTRDLSCRITGFRVGAQVAHLCPQKEQDWMDQNAMHQYNQLGEPGANDLSNLLLLRADLHIEFDSRKFVFAPKLTSPTESQLVVHVLKPEAELEHFYHNRKLQFTQGDGPRVEWLFARFAWSIFPFLNGFLTTKVPRRLRVYNENGEPIDDYFSAKKCVEFSTAPNAPKSRSQSPTKRQRPLEGEAQEQLEHETQSRKRLRHHQDLLAQSEPLRQSCKLNDAYSNNHGSPSRPSSASSSRNQDTVEIHQNLPQKFQLHDSQHSLNNMDSFSTNQEQSTLWLPTSPQHSMHTSPILDHDTDSNGIQDIGDPSHPADQFHTDSNVFVSTPRTAIAAAWLAKQRTRVDPTQLKQWEENERWAKEVCNGEIVLDGEKARKWFELMGAEVRD